ncbi:hypothetical protein FRC01_011175 [Tulasnella sp. 417]|nr:hypothetical protein FRC01_011175 [Tulasnella sp. 417]
MSLPEARTAIGIAPKPPERGQAFFLTIMVTAQAEIYSIPEVPSGLGEDGGQFWKHYDTVADELDDDLVKMLKSQLDGLLIFLINGNGSTVQTAHGLPSSSFSPTPAVYTVNVLFAISLTFALASSFLAVLGQQWLVYYQKRGSGGPDRERWEHLRRHLGAKRWKLELVLNDILPSLLQLGVAIFCASFVIYLGILNSKMCGIAIHGNGSGMGSVVPLSKSALPCYAPFIAFDGKSSGGYLGQVNPGAVKTLKTQFSSKN